MAPYARGIAEPEVSAFLRGFDRAETFSSAAQIICDRYTLYPRWDEDHWPSQWRLRSELQLLKKHPDLSSLFVFHGDGRIREAALNTMNGPIRFPVTVYGQISRLNDWVPEIRAAARLAFERTIRKTDAEILAPAVCVLMLNALSWRRWSGGFSEFIPFLLEPPNLMVRLVSRLLDEQGRGTTLIFRVLCQSPKIDAHLQTLALHARQPQVRAMALSVLCQGTATWPTGAFERLWVDKSMGRYRLVPERKSRPLSIANDVRATIRSGLDDPSVVVRKTALDALILRSENADFRDLMTLSVETMSDENKSVLRDRIRYLRKVLQPDHKADH